MVESYMGQLHYSLQRLREHHGRGGGKKGRARGWRDVQDVLRTRHSYCTNKLQVLFCIRLSGGALRGYTPSKEGTVEN